jgi:hypothetical protein
MSLDYKWGVKNGFTFALQFFLLISDLPSNFSYLFVTVYSILLNICVVPNKRDVRKKILKINEHVGGFAYCYVLPNNTI